MNELTGEGIKEVLEGISGRVAMGIVTSANRDHFDIIHGKLFKNVPRQMVVNERTVVEVRLGAADAATRRRPTHN